MNNNIKRVLRWVSLKRFWHWLDPIVTIRRREIAITVLIIIFLVIGSQYQVAAQNQTRIDSICDARKEGAKDLHDTLLKVVDLGDLFGDAPITEGVQLYINSRTTLVEQQYQEFLARGCP